MRILVHHNGQQLGPYTLEEVRAALANGSLQPSDLAWQEGTSDWVPLSGLVGAVGERLGATPMLPPDGATSGLAITSLILGILSMILCITGIPAIICGHIAQSQIRRSFGALKGSGMAITGLVMGYLATVALVLVFIAAIFFPAFANARSRSQTVISMNQARRLALQCQAYANDHGGKLPNLLEDLVPDYVQDNRGLADPGQRGNFDIGYLYFGTGRLITDSPNEILLESKATYGRNRVVATFSGNVNTVTVSSGANPPQSRLQR